ncbi:hypothetical protein DPEC_G00098110 [Dallia pectoralis]|uniref:Uncharacterized protein n=1 Tax=Dallia pectoralis TaxID=75939 RepID=A0ACC2GVK2_DALPE|nr:hypothetical protein DPEC_G00098110 [Dallia pectoralis]
MGPGVPTSVLTTFHHSEGNLSNVEHSSCLSLDHSLPLDLNPFIEKLRSKPSPSAIETNRCHVCGDTFPLKADLKRHVTLSKKTSRECRSCKKHYNTNCNLKAHFDLPAHSSEPIPPLTCFAGPFGGRFKAVYRTLSVSPLRPTRHQQV